MSGELIDLGAGCAFTNLTFSTSGGSTLGAAWRLHGTFPNNASVHTTWSNTSCSTNVSPTHFFIQLKDDTGALIHQEFPGCGTGPKSFTVLTPRPTSFLEWGIGSSLGAGDSTIAQLGVSATVDPCGTACIYGTQIKPGLPQAIVLTPTIVATVLANVGLGFLEPLMAPFVYTSFLITALCSQLPPPLPTIDLSTLQASVTTLLSIFRTAAWFTYCQCTPGTPPATNPLPPSATQPPGWPDQPAFTCSETDLCTSVIAIQKQLAVLAQVVSENLTMTTLIQRWNVPFGVIPSVMHGPLTGQGQIAIDRLIGLRVFIQNRPPNQPVISDVPPYVWNGGWISVTNEEGMLHERRVNRDVFDWLPEDMSLAQTIGYSLTPGTSVVIQELLAEP